MGVVYAQLASADARTHPSVRQDRRFIDRAFAFSCFALLLAANVSLFAPHVGGAPVRSILSAGTLVLSVALFPTDAMVVLRKSALILALAAGLAVEGSFVSFVNGAHVGDVVQQVIEVHVQTAVVLLATGILARVCGPRPCVIAIVAVVGVSAIFAILQMMHVEAAWSIRQALGPLATDENSVNLVDHRPTGLSFSPIWLATQICLAFAAFAAVRDKERQSFPGTSSIDPFLIIGLGVFLLTCLASGTRAPILGGFIFLIMYAALRRSWSLVLLVIGGMLLMYILLPLIVEAVQSTSPRVMVTDDNSAAARIVFAYYGVRLFLANPLGYGLTFDPTLMWGKYWPDLYLMKGAAGAQVHPLHDYALSMLNIYGVGLILFVPIIVRLLKKSGRSLLFFIPYIVHISFHNSGPFYNDMILWFAIAAIAATPCAAASGQGRVVRAVARSPLSRRARPTRGAAQSPGFAVR